MWSELAVGELSGERWDLAIELLRSGDGIVSYQQLLLYREAHGPRSDGALRAEIRSTFAPESLTVDLADADVVAGLSVLALVVADDRVGRLIDQFGLVRSYVHDYDTGRIKLATIAHDGTVTWSDGPQVAP